MISTRPKHILFTATLTVILLLACQLGPGPATPPPATATPFQAQPPTPTETSTAAAPTYTPTPSSTPTTVPSPTRTPTLAPTPEPTPTPTPTLIPTPQFPNAGPLPATWTELDFGLPPGDAYYPYDLAHDAESGLAYVLAQCASSYTPSGGREACISVYDLDLDQVLHTVAVPGSYDGRLVLAGDVVYLHYPWAGELYALDGESLARGELTIRGLPTGGESTREAIPDVLTVAFDGQETTYAVTHAGITRLAPDPFIRPFEIESSDMPVDMIATPDRVYTIGQETLWVWSAELDLIATVELVERWPRAAVLDDDHGRLYIGCGAGLYVLDVETNQLTEAPIHAPDGVSAQGIQRLALDQAGSRLYAIAPHPADWFGGVSVLAIDLESWNVQTLLSTLDGRLADLSFDEERNRLLVASTEDHALIPVDLARAEAARPRAEAARGQAGPRTPVGIQVSEVIVDEPGDRLYVSDSAGWIHVLDRRTYDVVGRVYGGRYISLDATHHRLYAGDPRVPVVTAFATGSLSVERTIAQSGKPRADPVTGEVTIVNRRFYVYDGASGAQVGEWLPGIGLPPEGCPGCYYMIAREVTIDARRGLTATTTYMPRPGKPGPLESIDYDPLSGRAYHSLLTGGYVHYSSIAAYPDLGVLQGRDRPTLYLEGLSGYLKLDPAARRLYVARGHILFVLDSETLNRVGRIHTDGWSPVIAAVDGELGRLYTPRDDVLVVWARTGGAHLPLLPPEPAVLTRTVTSILPSPHYAQDDTLLATIDGRLCRSTDGGETWQRLRGGLPELGDYVPVVNAAFSPDYANDGTIYAGAYVGDTHGEGVYRSTDGGETWESCADGLYDLRVYRVALSPNYARDHTLLAYARTQKGESLYRSTDGCDNWQLVVRQTSYGTPPLPRPEELFYDEVLPQFRCNYDGLCERSEDGGETWTRLDTRQFQPGYLLGYVLSPRYDRDHTAYWLTESAVYRYNDHTRTGQVCVAPSVYGLGERARDYTNALSDIAVAETGDGDQVLFIGSNAGEFLRLEVEDVPWVVVWPPSPSPTLSPPTPTPTPCAQGVDERLQGEGTGTETRPYLRLGCATGPGVETYVAFQPFERGAMFWREDTSTTPHAGRVYVLQQDATWSVYEDTWREGQLSRDSNLVPPEGLYQPIRGFGKVWREQLGGSEAEIGWATAPERGFTTVIQPFTHGLLLKGEDETVYVLYDDGSWQTLGEP